MFGGASTEQSYEERGIYMDPVTARFIENLEANAPAQRPTPQQARAGLDSLQSSYKLPADIVFEDRVLAVGPTGKTDVRIFHRKGISTPAPAVVYFHGGGFIKGGPLADGQLVSHLASCSDVVVVFVDYTLAPEGRYPLAHEQCYETLKYVNAHPDEFSTTANNISTAGDSVGAGIGGSGHRANSAPSARMVRQSVPRSSSILPWNSMLLSLNTDD